MYNKFSTAKAPPRITRGRRKKKAEPVPETPDLSNPQKSESASHLP
jgi:hypothetical protein